MIKLQNEDENNSEVENVDQMYDAQIQPEKISDSHADSETLSYEMQNVESQSTEDGDHQIFSNQITKSQKSKSKNHVILDLPSEPVSQTTKKQKKKVFKRPMGKTCGCLTICGDPIFTLGPHFTWCFFAGSSYFLTNKAKVKSNQSLQMFVSILCGVQLISYLACALKNPGIVSAKADDIADPSEYNYCSRCMINKMKNTYHCPDCDVCIREFDHHCPWTGKCIGGGNMFFFKIFITSTMIWFFLAFIILLGF